MVEREFLLNENEKQRKDYFEKKKAFFTNPSIGRIDPFKIADGLCRRQEGLYSPDRHR